MKNEDPYFDASVVTFEHDLPDIVIRNAVSFANPFMFPTVTICGVTGINRSLDGIDRTFILQTHTAGQSIDVSSITDPSNLVIETDCPGETLPNDAQFPLYTTDLYAMTRT